MKKLLLLLGLGLLLLPSTSEATIVGGCSYMYNTIRKGDFVAVTVIGNVLTGHTSTRNLQVFTADPTLTNIQGYLGNVDYSVTNVPVGGTATNPDTGTAYGCPDSNAPCTIKFFRYPALYDADRAWSCDNPVNGQDCVNGSEAAYTQCTVMSQSLYRPFLSPHPIDTTPPCP